mgnify:CR=1 FL=1
MPCPWRFTTTDAHKTQQAEKRQLLFAAPSAATAVTAAALLWQFDVYNFTKASFMVAPHAWLPALRLLGFVAKKQVSVGS